MGDPHDIKSIFLAASEKPPTERAAYLDQAVGGDAALRARVEALLKAHDNPDSFLNEPGAALGVTVDLSRAEPLAERPGTLIGPYKLLEQIGEGGMGVVYMADQQSPVRRRVALKIIKPGMDTRQVIARFEAERQALALMDHANIARVLDAGATSTGRPYFVMDLVKGVAITEYCDQQQLPVRERLELMSAVCHAVQHAHQKGIIHRDLKPSNVLVTVNDGRAVPKVIDFGVAKATGQQLTEKTLFTAFSQMVGTPLYMSPEQAEMTSVDVDTRSDIYSLGVLLYELLTGTTPFDKERLRTAAFDELLRIICEEEPQLPSTRLASSESLPSISANRSLEPKKLGGVVRGELDWIVMKCLEKDRNRRYETASELSVDLQRYLADEPVEARPSTRTYRLKKFVRRNKTGVLAATAIIAALMLGLALAWISAVRARMQAARSDEVAHFLKDTLAAAGPSVARGHDATLLREILAKTAERVEKDLQDQPEVQGDLWFTLGSTYEDISDDDRGMGMFQRAAESYRIALGEVNAKRALALARLGSMRSMTGNVSDGRETAQLAVDIARRCGDPAVLAECLYHRAIAGRIYSWSGRTGSDDLPLLRESVSLFRQTGEDPLGLIRALNRLAYSSPEPVEAEALSREALSLGRKHLPADHPEIANLLSNLGCILIDRGKLAEAEESLRVSVELHRKLHAKGNPLHKAPRRRLVEALARRGKWDEAESLVRESLKDPAQNEVTQVFYCSMLVKLLASRGQLQLALDELARFREMHPASNDLRIQRCSVLLQAGKQEECRRECHEFLQTMQSPFAKAIVAKLACLLPVGGPDLERACQWAIDGVTNQDWNLYEDLEVLAPLAQALAEYRQGHFESANHWANVVIENNAEGPFWAQAKITQAMALSRLEQKESARQTLSEVDELLRKPHVDFLTHHYIGGFGEWTLAALLRREAEALIQPIESIGPPGATDSPIRP